jgi:acetylornithine deacetylase/succinyl-diaminopimelate desuccinylase-like protein
MGVIDDCVALVRIDSQNPGTLEHACAAWLQERLQRAGITASRRDTADGRPNLVAAVPGTGQVARLVLLAHMDTVPVGEGWSVGPLRGAIRDSAVWGRGAADMKGGLAVAIAVLESLSAGPPPPGEVMLCVTADEEGPNMGGIHALVAGGVVGADDQVLALEPTGLRLRLAQVGLRWLELEVRGRMTHGGRVHRDGIDANHLAALMAVELKQRFPSLTAEHEMLGPPRITCSGLHGGVAANVVPASCTLTLDARVVPPLLPEDAERLTRQVAADVCAGFPGSSFELRPLGVARPPIVADELCPLVRGLRRAYLAETGRPLEHGGEDGHEAYTDASMVAALTGSRSCTVWGPGHPSQAHAADEHVAIAELEAAQRILTRLARETGGPSQS